MNPEFLNGFRKQADVRVRLGNAGQKIMDLARQKGVALKTWGHAHPRAVRAMGWGGIIAPAVGGGIAYQRGSQGKPTLIEDPLVTSLAGGPVGLAVNLGREAAYAKQNPEESGLRKAKQVAKAVAPIGAGIGLYEIARRLRDFHPKV